MAIKVSWEDVFPAARVQFKPDCGSGLETIMDQALKNRLKLPKWD